MAGTRIIFVYKCDQSHITKKEFPPRTNIDAMDETTCAECLKNLELRRAYLIWTEPKKES